MFEGHLGKCPWATHPAIRTHPLHPEGWAAGDGWLRVGALPPPNEQVVTPSQRTCVQIDEMRVDLAWKDEEEACLLSTHFACTIPSSHSLWQPFASECFSGILTWCIQQPQLKQKKVMLMLTLEKAAVEQRERRWLNFELSFYRSIASGHLPNRVKTFSHPSDSLL